MRPRPGLVSCLASLGHIISVPITRMIFESPMSQPVHESINMTGVGGEIGTGASSCPTLP